MLKYNLIILTLLCFSTIAKAQYPNGGENNTYLYGEKDGVNTSNNGVLQVLRSGEILNWVYGGVPFLIGNNYIQQLDLPNAKNLTLSVCGYATTQSDSFWIASANKGYLFYRQKLIDSFVLPSTYTLGAIVTNNNFNYLIANNNKVMGVYYHHRLKTFSPAIFKVNTDYKQFFTNSDGKFCLGILSEYCIVDTNGYGKMQYNNNVTGNEFLLNPYWNKGIRIYQNKGETGIYKLVNNHSIFTGLHAKQFGLFACNNYVPIHNNGYVNIYKIDTGENKKVASFSLSRNINSVYNFDSKSYYVNSTGSALRLFGYIKKYPKIYTNNANENFALQQDYKGRIWAGSYNGGICIIDSNKSKFIYTPNIKITNGGCVVNDKVYLIGEGFYNGLLQCSSNGSYRKITNNVTGFINYVDPANKILYFGTHQKGLYFTQLSNLEKQKIDWTIVDKKQGLNLFNILTITKDRKDRIWLGHSSRGWAVYYPKQNKATTFLIENNQTNFGTLSSCTDSKGTVWLGTKQQGLLYYNSYEKDTVNPKDIKAIEHPLLPKGKTITAMVQHGNWLIMGVTNYCVAFDLATWYSTGKVLVKYLNPHEANFTSETEQNTLLVDKRDSSVWFCTSDMLYQLDFKTWLQLPTYTATPAVNIRYNSIDSTILENKTFELQPTQNTINLQVWFQTVDNMPRYIATAFGNADDSLTFENITLNTHYTYSNLASGHYVFKVLICQSDGSVSYHDYYITVSKFWWQYWWVWVLASVVVCTPIVLWQNAKRKQAILLAEKEEQKKQLANLQLVTLSNQFRPHFILNALNAIGTQLQGKPKAESVLSRLGESVNIIFNHSLNNKPTQSFANEWKLVTNIIQLHQLMYLQDFVCTLPEEKEVQQLDTFELPMGILQIPVENALVHGLGNNIDTTKNEIAITILNTENRVDFIITDTGIGRTKAQQLSNFTKHGMGSKNLLAIIEMLNKNNANKIAFVYEDDIYERNSRKYGTKVTITIPKHFNYE